MVLLLAQHDPSNRNYANNFNHLSVFLSFLQELSFAKGDLVTVLSELLAVRTITVMYLGQHLEIEVRPPQLVVCEPDTRIL